MKPRNGIKLLAALALMLFAAMTAGSGSAATLLPESAHPYAPNADISWSYTHPVAAEYLQIQFSPRTMVENGYDFLTITDHNGDEYRYTGNALAGKALTIPGNQFTIHLQSDYSNEYYGFSMESVKAVSPSHFTAPVFEVRGSEITKVTGGAPGETLIVPEEINGRKITAIGRDAFRGTDFGRIELPEGITTIGKSAFRECKYLKTVVLPASVTSMGESVFRASAIASVQLPAGLDKVPNYTFSQCMCLTSVSLPGTIFSIGNSAFKDCSALKNISLPAGLEKIDVAAFEGCLALQHITIPAGVTRLPSSAFGSCKALTQVTLKAPATALESFAFCYCDNLKIIDGIVDSLKDDTFFYTTGLTSLSLSNNVTHLPNAMLANHELLLIVGQDSPLRPLLNENGRPYQVRETGEMHNAVAGGTMTVSEKVDAIVAALIRPDMTDYQKSLVLHNWLTMNAQYDQTYSHYKPDGVLLYGTGVCQSYALAYQLLLNKVGIENCLEYGDNHMWNMIRLDGEWYHVDVTWDDPIVNGGMMGYENWDFFCLSNYALEGVDSHECYEKPQIATAYAYNYNYRNGLYDQRLQEVEETITAHLKAGETEFSFRPATFTTYDYGVANRTCALIVQDTEYQLDGKAVTLTITYDDKTQTFTVKCPMRPADMTLPAFLTTIEEEAFAGLPVTAIHIPEGVQAIGPRAFADCANLCQVQLPASVTEIDATAFAGAKGLTIFAPAGSAAEAFATAQGFAFTAIK